MIINTGMRTDIPAFYSEWFQNRLREGFVMVRSPYDPNSVTRYELDPNVVDIMVFCTKNPRPILSYIDEIKKFGLYFFVTITPYGRDIEPNVPDYGDVFESFKILSREIGREKCVVRYDPIFLSDIYDYDRHIAFASEMAKALDGCTNRVVISFIDLYEKTKRNFPEAKAVDFKDQMRLAEDLVRIFKPHGITVQSCFEDSKLKTVGVDISGCMTQRLLEEANGIRLEAPKGAGARKGCDCLTGNDIGSYNSCLHLCRYCYANYDEKEVRANAALHDPKSPLLIGHLKETDVVHNAIQKSDIKKQVDIFDILQGDS